MNEYKKGVLLIKSTQKKYTFKVSVCDGLICNYCKEFYDFYKKLPKERQQILDNAFSKTQGTIDNPQVKELLLEYCKDKTITVKQFPIIYKDCFDVDGNKYGRELLTSKVFPISKKVNYYFTVTKKKEKDNLYHGKKYLDPHHIYERCGKNIDDRRFYDFVDLSVNFFYFRGKVEYEDESVVYWLYSPQDTSDSIGTIIKAPVKCYEVSMSLEYVHNNANRLEVSLLPIDYANDDEVNRYQSKGLFFAKNIRLKNIFKLSSLNNLGIIEYDNSSRTKESSDMISLINDIELMLNQTKDINESLYEELYSKYQSIIEEDSNIETDKFKELQDFYDNLSKKVNLSSNDCEACELLDGYISKLIDNMMNERYSNINIQYITNLHNDFVNYENNYSIKTIQTINTKFNLIYFFYLYNNRDNYDKDEISSSYIPSSMKGIINVIALLSSNGVISNSSDSIYYNENMTIDDLLSLISSICIKDIGKAKELIKL